jgi:hypothetical protein
MRTRELVIPGVIEAAGLQVEERELDALRPAEALIVMEAAGVSYAEVAMLRGLYPGQPAFPFVPGYDLVGKIIEVGPGVDRSFLGKRVATITETGAWSVNVIRPVLAKIAFATRFRGRARIGKRMRLRRGALRRSVRRPPLACPRGGGKRAPGRHARAAHLPFFITANP